MALKGSGKSRSSNRRAAVVLAALVMLGLLLATTGPSMNHPFAPPERTAVVSSSLTYWNVTGSGFGSGVFNGTSTDVNGSLFLGPMVPPSNRQIVVDVGPSGSPDSLYARSPFVLHDTDGTYKMWYAGQDGYRNRLLYATSPDGISWTKRGVVIDVQTPPYYFDSVGGESVIKDGSTYEMWFHGGFWTGPYGFWGQIYHATSTDGATWSITGVALPPGQTWAHVMVNNPFVVQDAHGTDWMFYTGWDGSIVQVGVATSTNGTWFTPASTNPIVPLGPSGSWDSGSTYAASGFWNGTTWTLWYSGSNGITTQIGLAHSSDGFNWTRDGANPTFVSEASPTWDDAGVMNPDFLNDTAGPRLYFAGSDGTYIRIGRTAFGPANPVSYRGGYLSPVFDSGSDGTQWESLAWSGGAPLGSAISVSVRTGETPAPDSGWTVWTNLTPSGAAQPPAVSALSLPRDRFFQFEVGMVSGNWTVVPHVRSVSLAYRVDQGPAVTLQAPGVGAWTNAVRPSLEWNASDPEGDPLLSSTVQVSSSSSFATVYANITLAAGAASWQVTPSLGDGTWFWRVQVEDSYGIWGAWAYGSFGVDTAPPALVVSSPAPGALLRTNSLDVVWQASDSESGLAPAQVTLDSGTPIVVPAGNSSLHLANLADGNHAISVRMFDRAGNYQTVTLTVMVDTTAPQLSITSPSAGALLHTGTLTVSWTASDATSGIDSIQVSVDGGSPTTLAPGATSLQLSGLSDGAHTIALKATDRAGNIQTATVSVTIDSNLLSLTGPAGALPMALVIAAAVVAALAVGWFVLRARKHGPKTP